MKTFDLSLYLVLDPGLCAGLGMLETARAAVAGGATMVQLRDKTASPGALIATGLALKRALAGSGARLVVNDDIEAAIAIGADALHLGQDDGDPRAARARIGPDMILGLSVETEALAAAVDPAVVDYVGAGPVFATTTKPGHKPPFGVDGLRRIVASSPMPLVAIGGLKAEHVAGVLGAGAQGLAVVSAICGTADPYLATRHLADTIRKARR